MIRDFRLLSTPKAGASAQIRISNSISTADKGMTNSTSKNRKLKPNINPQKLSPEKYARLRAEAKAPYRGLRKFIYVAVGGSGFIGGVVFLAELAAGREIGTALPNLALQIGVVALMVWLFRLEQKAERNLKGK